MITREEAKKLPAFCLIDDRVSLYLEEHIDKIYESLEAERSQVVPFLTVVENVELRERIAELESQLSDVKDMNRSLGEQLVKYSTPKSCASCAHFQTRYNIKSYVAYYLCTKEVSNITPFFGCIYHEPKGQA